MQTSPKALLVAFLLSVGASAAQANEEFMAACKGAMAGGQGGGEMMCGCFAEGLSAGASADELLAIAKAPREGRREVVQSASQQTRQVMRGCMQKMRGASGGGPRSGGQE
ncbi:MAG: hypothetical protein ACFHX7_05180 [Pseudomonadota bacterium]